MSETNSHAIMPNKDRSGPQTRNATGSQTLGHTIGHKTSVLPHPDEILELFGETMKRLQYPPVNEHSHEKSPFSIGDTSSKGSFSIAMLIDRSVSSFGDSSNVQGYFQVPPTMRPLYGKFPILFPYLYGFLWEWYGKKYGKLPRKGSHCWGSLKIPLKWLFKHFLDIRSTWAAFKLTLGHFIVLLGKKLPGSFLLASEKIPIQVGSIILYIKQPTSILNTAELEIFPK